MQTSGWLTEIGREELHLIKELGWDHPDVLEAQHRFRDAYKAVKAIRKIYESSPAQRSKTNG
jgi:hypothetical protein